MKSILTSPAAILLLFTTMSASAQTNPQNNTPADPETAQLLAQLALQKSVLDAQTALNNSQAAQVKSEQDLTTAKGAADKAAQTARETDITSALTKIQTAAATLPTGAVTTASGVNVTPDTAALALKATQELALATAGLIKDKVATLSGARQPSTPPPKPTKPVVIFVDKLPTPTDTWQFQYWLEAADQLEKKYKALETPVPELTQKAGGAHPQSLLLAASLAAALPGVINAAAGLFRSDYSEKSGDLAIDSSGFQSFVVAELCKADSGMDIYPSFEAYVASRLVSPHQLKVADRVARLQAARVAIGEAAAKILSETERTQKQLDDYNNGLTAARATADTIATRIFDFEEKVETAGQGKDLGSERVLAVLKTRQVTANAAVQTAKNALNPVEVGKTIAALKDKTRLLTAMQTELSDFLTSTLSAGTDGQLKVLQLFRQELLHQAAYPSDFADDASFPKETRPVAERAAANKLYFVTLNVRLKPHSVIEKKSIWSHKYFAAGLLAIDYQIGNADGRLVDAGAKWQGYTKMIPLVKKLGKLNSGN